MTRRVSSRVAARSLVLVLIGLPAWSQNPDPEICAQPNYTTGLFTCNGTDCPPEGLGAHPVLNPRPESTEEPGRPADRVRSDAV